MLIFRQKPWVNPFSKMTIFRPFELDFFYSLEWRLFVLEYRKRHYPGRYCLTKKVGNMLIFGQKPWANPFGKMSILILLELIVFTA